MAKTGKAAEDTESILERLRRESFSSEAALEEMLLPSKKAKEPPTDDSDGSEDIDELDELDELDRLDRLDGRTDTNGLDTTEISAERQTQAEKDVIEERTPPSGEARPRQSAAELLQELLADEEKRSEMAAELEEEVKPPPRGGFLQGLFEKWLSPEGRMGQKLFVLHLIGSLVAAAGLAALVTGVTAAVLSWLGAGRPMPSENISLAAAFAAILFISVPLALLLIVFLRAAMRRWHDLGYGDTAWLIAVICPLMILALAEEGRILLLFLGLPPLLGVAPDHLLLKSALPYGGAALALLILLHVYLIFAEGEFSSNASGSPESAADLRPYIAERPKEDYPFFLRMLQLKGRMNRKRFLLRLLFLLFFVSLLVFVVLETAERLPQPLGNLVALYGTSVSCALAAILPIGIVTQRLHDIGRSGWLAGVPLALTLAFIGCLAFFGGDPRLLAREPFGLEIIAAAFALEIYEVFLLAVLVFVKGSVTVNNYGESTLERQ